MKNELIRDEPISLVHIKYNLKDKVKIYNSQIITTVNVDGAT